MAEFYSESTLSVDVQGEEAVNRLTAALAALQGQAISVQRAVSAAGAAGAARAGVAEVADVAEQAANQTRTLGQRLTQAFTGAMNTGLRAPLEALRATAQVAGGSLRSFLGPLGQIAGRAGAGGTAILALGAVITGLAAPVLSLVAGFRLLRSSFGWAQEAAEEQLRISAMTRRFFPQAVGEGIAAAEEEMRVRIGVTTALFGAGAEQMQQQITRRFTEYRLGRGLRGEADIFSRWGITAQGMARFQEMTGSPLDLQGWLRLWIVNREQIEQRLQNAQTPEERRRLENRLAMMSEDVTKMYGAEFARMFGALNSRDLVRLQENINRAAVLGRARDPQSTQRDALQFRVAMDGLWNTFSQLKTSIGNDVRPSITNFMNQLNERILAVDENGQSLFGSLRRLASALVNRAWDVLLNIMRRITPERLNEWIERIQQWIPENTADRIETIFTAIWSFGQSIASIAASIANFMAAIQPWMDWLNRLHVGEEGARQRAGRAPATAEGAPEAVTPTGGAPAAPAGAGPATTPAFGMDAFRAAAAAPAAPAGAAATVARAAAAPVVAPVRAAAPPAPVAAPPAPPPIPAAAAPPTPTPVAAPEAEPRPSPLATAQAATSGLFRNIMARHERAAAERLAEYDREMATAAPTAPVTPAPALEPATAAVAAAPPTPAEQAPRTVLGRLGDVARSTATNLKDFAARLRGVADTVAAPTAIAAADLTPPPAAVPPAEAQPIDWRTQIEALTREEPPALQNMLAPSAIPPSWFAGALEQPTSPAAAEENQRAILTRIDDLTNAVEVSARTTDDLRNLAGRLEQAQAAAPEPPTAAAPGPPTPPLAAPAPSPTPTPAAPETGVLGGLRGFGERFMEGHRRVAAEREAEARRLEAVRAAEPIEPVVAPRGPVPDEDRQAGIEALKGAAAGRAISVLADVQTGSGAELIMRANTYGETEARRRGPYDPYADPSETRNRVRNVMGPWLNRNFGVTLPGSELATAAAAGTTEPAAWETSAAALTAPAIIGGGASPITAEEGAMFGTAAGVAVREQLQGINLGWSGASNWEKAATEIPWTGTDTPTDL